MNRTAFQGLQHIVGNRFNFIAEKCGRGIGLVVYSFNVTAGIGGAAEEKQASACSLGILIHRRTL
jgi:hypothetical protein